MGPTHTLEKRAYFDSPVEDVFSFHTSMETVHLMLPDHLSVEPVCTPGNFKLGDTITFRAHLRGFSFSWQTIIIEYDQNVSFTDLLEKGPFSFWRHQHLFTEHNGGTMMTDRIEYKVASGFFGLVPHFIIHKELERVFADRHKKARKHIK